MKKLLIFLPFLMISGCQAVSQISQTATQASTGCPREPKNIALTREDVKNVLLNSGTVKESGQASADRFVGYAFEAKAGEKLSYHTTDDICIWLYTQDNKLLSSGNLPQDGKYILQVSAPKGSTTFNLEMTLGSLQANVPSVSPSPSVTTSIPPSATPVNTEASDLTQEQALAIVQRWFEAKPRIFAPPFDTSLVDELATGKFHDDETKPGGSIDTLRSSNSYYTYNYSRINDVIEFTNSGKRPAIIVSTEEELYLHGPNGIDSDYSGKYKNKRIYYFDKDNGQWKISDSQKIKSISSLSENGYE